MEDSSVFQSIGEIDNYKLQKENIYKLSQFVS